MAVYKVTCEVEDVSEFAEGEPWYEEVAVMADSDEDARAQAPAVVHRNHPDRELFVIVTRLQLRIG